MVLPVQPAQPGEHRPGWLEAGAQQRRVTRFSPAGEQDRCAVELTEVRFQHRDWWSLGLEATGPAESLRHGLEATAALVFAHALPGGVELRIDDSWSYADWLRTR